MEMNNYLLCARVGVFFLVAISCSIIDLKTMRIPTIYLLLGGSALVAIDLFIDLRHVPFSIGAAGIAFLVFYGIKRLTNGMGLGDVKYAAFLGYFSGLAELPGVFLLAAASGLVFALWAVKFRGLDRKTRIPFAPFLSIGGLLPSVTSLYSVFYPVFWSRII
jgi:leader peptidase (prepilin peptidase) / N-methyltransferase